jgi:hypothetical protein
MNCGEGVELNVHRSFVDVEEDELRKVTDKLNETKLRVKKLERRLRKSRREIVHFVHHCELMREKHKRVRRIARNLLIEK